MVDPDHVKQLLVVADAVYPEPIARLLQVIPVVDGVAPALAGGAEIIRRHSRDEGGPAVPVQKEVFLPRPHVHGIDPHVEGNVPHNADPIFTGLLPHLHPLAVKQVLKEHLIGRLCLHVGGKGASLLRPGLVRLLPLIPADAAVDPFQGPEDAVFFHPGLGDKFPVVVGGLEPGKGFPQEGVLEGPDLIVAHPGLPFQKWLRLLFQKPLLL